MLINIHSYCTATHCRTLLPYCRTQPRALPPYTAAHCRMAAHCNVHCHVVHYQAHCHTLLHALHLHYHAHHCHTLLLTLPHTATLLHTTALPDSCTIHINSNKFTCIQINSNNIISNHSNSYEFNQNYFNSYELYRKNTKIVCNFFMSLHKFTCIYMHLLVAFM
jgi:hypothetical protein